MAKRAMVTCDGVRTVSEFEEPTSRIEHLSFPFRLIDISLPDSDLGARRQAIERNNGRVVALRFGPHKPEEFYVAQVRFDPKDSDNFYFAPIRSMGEPMHEEKAPYAALQQLMESRYTISRDLLGAWIGEFCQSGR